MQRLPIAAGRFSGLIATEDALFYTAYPAINGEGEPDVRRFDFETQDDQRLLMARTSRKSQRAGISCCCGGTMGMFPSQIVPRMRAWARWLALLGLRLG